MDEDNAAEIVRLLSDLNENARVSRSLDARNNLIAYLQLLLLFPLTLASIYAMRIPLPLVGWDWTFAVFIILTLVVFVLIARYVPYTPT